MTSLSSKSVSKAFDELRFLEQEITILERNIQEKERRLNAFESQIRSGLYYEILRIRELTHLYKQQKQAKKAKRLEQKKRGKNYKEPKGVKKTNSILADTPQLKGNKQKELRRLYKEAIVLIHPDKFVNEEADKMAKATQHTIQLNALYKSNKLEELSQFHEHIISGNAMAHVPLKREAVPDEQALLKFLLHKKEKLQQHEEQLINSPTYKALQECKDSASFIAELRVQFQQRISQLQKRTRKG